MNAAFNYGMKLAGAEVVNNAIQNNRTKATLKKILGGAALGGLLGTGLGAATYDAATEQRKKQNLPELSRGGHILSNALGLAIPGGMIGWSADSMDKLDHKFQRKNSLGAKMETFNAINSLKDKQLPSLKGLHPLFDK